MKATKQKNWSIKNVLGYGIDADEGKQNIS